jgi:flavin-dependent dehydrogenase
MTKLYDLIVVGAGPAGIMAAKVAAQNGLSVVLVERKDTIPAITRSCATMFAIEDDYFFGERMFFNDKQKRLVFPVNGFSVNYDGPHKNFYGQMLYAPDGKTCLKIGDYEENLKKGDSGRLSVVYDKETLLRGMLREAKEAGAEIIPGMNVSGVTRNGKTLSVTTMTDDTFEGTFVIAADGLNSRIAEVLELNKKRLFYGTVTTISYAVTGVTLPAPYTYKMTNIFEEQYGIPLTFGIVPKATGDETFWFFGAGPADAHIDYEEEIQRFMKSSPFSSWFEKAELGERNSAILNFWSPVEDPYCDNVLLIGDAAWSIEAEITGSIMCGWKAANALTLALRDNKPTREGVETYLAWWKESFLHYDYKGYLRSLAMLYVLDADDVRYVYSLLDKPLPCTLNPHKLEELMNAAILERVPAIQSERPEILEKFQRLATEPLEELLKVLRCQGD